MDFEVLGWPPAGPKLELPWQEFSYAGKFVMTNTGKTVARADGEILAAASFNEDRTDPEQVWIRYITVREGHRGGGIGPRLARFTVSQVLETSYEAVRIAVNNPFAYEALHKAGFGFTGEETGMAELVLVAPAEPDRESYISGLERFAERDLDPPEASFVAEKRRRGSPPDRLKGIR